MKIRKIVAVGVMVMMTIGSLRMMAWAEGKGATPEQTQTHNIFRAIEAGEVGEVKALLKAGVDANQVNEVFEPPLIAALENPGEQTAEIVKALIVYGATVDYRGNAIPIITAAWENRPEVIAILINAGADVGAADRNGYTALHEAAEHNSVEAVRMLLKAGAKVNATSELGYTPLHMAVGNNSPEVVQALLEAKANVHAKTQEGLTVLDMVQRRGANNTDTQRINAMLNEALVNSLGSGRSKRQIASIKSQVKSESEIYGVLLGGGRGMREFRNLEKAKENTISRIRDKVGARGIGFGYAQLLIRLLRNAESFEEVRAIG